MPETGKPHVEMRRHDIAVVRLIGILGWVSSALTSVRIPALYCTFALQGGEVRSGNRNGLHGQGDSVDHLRKDGNVGV